MRIAVAVLSLSLTGCAHLGQIGEKAPGGRVRYRPDDLFLARHAAHPDDWSLEPTSVLDRRLEADIRINRFLSVLDRVEARFAENQEVVAWVEEMRSRYLSEVVPLVDRDVDRLKAMMEPGDSLFHYTEVGGRWGGAVGVGV